MLRSRVRNQSVTLAGPASAGSVRKRQAVRLFSGIAADYDRVGAALSFGQDARWRRGLVDWVAPASTDRVLDVATGTGLVAARLVRCHGCAVVGVDQSVEMLESARVRLAGDARLAARIELVRGEAERLPFPDGSFDALTFSYLLRYVDDPGETMRELARVVRPGGRIGMIEFGVPPRPGLRRLWRLYTRLGLPAAGGAVSAQWRDVGRFLGQSIEGFWSALPGGRLIELWREASIEAVEVRRMSYGAGVLMVGVRAR
jgi:demethylmenaquinone methyltransferase/2-methoxy-6-polyprenyl-1,4-benzoquinol methylase